MLRHPHTGRPTLPVIDRIKALFGPPPTSNGSAPPAESKAIPTLVGGTSNDFGLVWLGQGANREVDDLTRGTAYATSLYCYAAMQYRAQKISEPPLLVAEATDDGEQWVQGHELEKLLDRPNMDQDMGALLMATSFFLDADGECLWVMSEGEHGPQLYPFPRNSFEVQYGPDRLYSRFDVTFGGGTRQFSPEDVIYFRDPSPSLTNRPTSRLDAALSWANLGHQVREGIKDAFRGGVMPVSVFSYPEGYNPDVETRERNSEEIQARYGGMRQRGTPMALYGGLSASFTNIDLEALLPDEMIDRVEANVGLAFGVRPEVLGMLVGLRNSPWSHMDQARRVTYEDVIQPMWSRIEKTLTHQLLSDADQDAGQIIRFDASGVRALQDDEKARAEIARTNAGIWTRDERRVYTGKDPLEDERGEEITGHRQPSASPQITASRTVPWDTKSDGTRHLLWAEFDLSAKAQERVWEPEVAKLLAAQADDVQGLFRRYVRESGGTVDPSTLAQFLEEVRDYIGAEGAEKARRTLGPLVESTAQNASRRLTARLGIDFNVVQEGLAKYAAEETDFLVSVMGESTGKAVARTVQSSVEEAIPLRDLRGRLEELPEFSRTRAQLVARTETTRATNGAQRRTAEEFESQTGERIEKSWLSSRDDRVRDEHWELDDGEWYAVDHEWPNGLKSPGEPNCRCTLEYRIAPEAGR